MNRLLALVVSAMLCWGGATACSGGGGDGSSSPDLASQGNNGVVNTGGTNGGNNGGDIGLKPPVIPAVIPTAVITGVDNGKIYGEVSLIADASESRNAVSYAWSLTAPSPFRPQSGSNVSFPFLLPKNDTPDPIQYVLKLTTTSSDGHTATTTIHPIAAAKPVADITTDDMTTGAVDSVVYQVPTRGTTLQAPAGKLLTFSAVGNPNNASLKWTVQERKTISTTTLTDVSFTLSANSNQIQFKAPDVGAIYTVKLEATGDDGRTDTTQLVFGIVYGAWANVSLVSATQSSTTAVHTVPTVLVGSPVTLTYDVTTTDGSPLVIKSQSWTDRLGGKIGSDATFAVDTSVAGSHYVSVRVTAADGTPVSLGSYSLNVAKPPVPSIGGIPSTKIVPIGQPMHLTFTATDAGTAPTWSITGLGATPMVLSGVTAKPNPEFVPTAAGDYTVGVTVTNTDNTFSNTPPVTATFTAMAVPVAAIQSPDILAGHSYAQSTVLHASDTSGATTSSWSLQLQNSTQSPKTFTGSSIALPKLLPGAYVLTLTSTNVAGSTPATLPFNIRPKIVSEITWPSMVNVMAATDSTNIFAGGFHFGADKRWVKPSFPFSSANVMFARSAGEVYFASGSQVYRFTDSGGTQSVGNIAPYIVTHLTGDAQTLYAVTAGQQVYQSTDNGKTWSPVTQLASYLVNFAVVRNPGELVFEYDAGLGGKMATLSSSGVVSEKADYVTGVLDVSASPRNPLVYIGGASGVIYSYDPVTTSRATVGVLPKIMINGVSTQQLVVAIDADTMTVLTQNGGVFDLHVDTTDPTNKFFPIIHAPGAFTISSGDINAAGTFATKSDGTLLQYNADGSKVWLPVSYPQSTLSKTATKVSARTIGRSVFLLNAQDSVNLGSIQKIGPEGSFIRMMKGPATTIYGAWGPDENTVYFLTDAGLMKWDGSKSVSIQSTYKDQKGVVITKQPSEVFVDISGSSATNFFVATNLNIYHTTDAGLNFVAGTPVPSGYTYTSVYVQSGGAEFIGSNPSTLPGISGGGTLVLRGSSDGGLFAVQGDKTIYQYKSGAWSLVTGTGVLFPQSNCVITDFTVVSQDEAWFASTCSGGSVVVRYAASAFDYDNLLVSQTAQFLGVVGDQVYYGGAIGTDLPIHVYEYGPMQ